ncbi:hypothetical protein [Roseovarius sp.]|jgi:hypothetical protein
MTEHIKFGGKSYDYSLLSAEGRRTLEMLKYTIDRLQEAQQKEEALKRAKNAFVSDLRAEIVKGTSGIDLDALLGD